MARVHTISFDAVIVGGGVIGCAWIGQQPPVGIDGAGHVINRIAQAHGQAVIDAPAPKKRDATHLLAASRSDGQGKAENTAAAPIPEHRQPDIGLADRPASLRP